MEDSRSEGKTRAQANHPPLLWFCNGCTFGTAVNASLSISYPETINSQGLLQALAHSDRSGRAAVLTPVKAAVEGTS